VKKGFVIEQALLHHLQALSELPEEVVVVSHHLPFCPSREQARRRYRRFVHEGVGETIWQGLRGQIHLGDEAFVTRMQRNAQITGDRPPERSTGAAPSSRRCSRWWPTPA